LSRSGVRPGKVAGCGKCRVKIIKALLIKTRRIQDNLGNNGLSGSPAGEILVLVSE
jgi:hypothetical protein